MSCILLKNIDKLGSAPYTEEQFIPLHLTRDMLSFLKTGHFPSKITDTGKLLSHRVILWCQVNKEKSLF